MTSFDRPIVLIYDAGCPVCRSFATALDRSAPEGGLDCRPLSDDTVFEEHPQLDPTACSRELHIVDEHGVVHAGAAIVEPLASRVPLIRSIAWMMQLPGGDSVVETAMDVAGKVRTAFSLASTP